jgi:hypothetical protein
MKMACAHRMDTDNAATPFHRLDVTRHVMGFFDVDRVTQRYSERLQSCGWVPVLGDPHRVVMWRVGFWGRLRWLLTGK